MANIGTGKNMSKAEYDSSSDNKKENERLKTQASTIEVFDGHVMDEFIDAIVQSGKQQGETIYILELGGADMNGARVSRYNDRFFKKIEELGYKVQIVNAEYNEKAIEDADREYGDMFNNINVDLNKDPENALTDIVSKYNNGNKFDMIFSNYVLQHLVDPKSVMSAVKSVLSEKGLSMHRVPDDNLKINGFYLNGQPNEKANESATGIVNLFLTTLTRARTDRRLGGKMFDVCTSGYAGQEGCNFNTVYDRIATEVVDESSTNDNKKKYLIRDFRWYMFALEEAGQETDDPEFKNICLNAAMKAKAYYSILEKEFLQEGASYQYGEHEIIVSNGLQLTNSSKTIENIDENRKVTTINRLLINEKNQNLNPTM